MVVGDTGTFVWEKGEEEYIATGVEGREEVVSLCLGSKLFRCRIPVCRREGKIHEKISFASSLNHLLTNEYTCRYTIRPARLDTWPPQTTPQVALYANHSGTTT